MQMCHVLRNIKEIDEHHGSKAITYSSRQDGPQLPSERKPADRHVNLLLEGGEIHRDEIQSIPF